MQIGPKVDPVTAISTSNPETIVIRGHDLCKDLLGRISFTDHVWLLIVGTLPNPAQRNILDATLVALAEHGLVPSVQASRMTLAAAPEAMQGAVAAGILGCGSVILGSSEAAGIFLTEILAMGSNADNAIRAKVADYRSAKKPIPGYGHPLHKSGDPRALRLIEYAGELKTAGRHVELAKRVEQVLPELVQRPLRMNVSVAIAAVLLDAGFPVQALKGIPILARTASLVAHLLEEQLKPLGFELSRRASSGIRYTGSVPDGFVSAED